jgi:hypothetical protein
MLSVPTPAPNVAPTPPAANVSDLIRNIQKGMSELTANLNKITDSVAKLNVH